MEVETVEVEECGEFEEEEARKDGVLDLEWGGMEGGEEGAYSMLMGTSNGIKTRGAALTNWWEKRTGKYGG